MQSSTSSIVTDGVQTDQSSRPKDKIHKGKSSTREAATRNMAKAGVDTHY